MDRTSKHQLRALMFMLLLVGSDAARVEETVGMLEMDQIRQEASATLGAFSQLGAGSPVCKSMTDPEAAIERYEAKRTKVLALSGKILEKSCIASCPFSLTKLSKRLSEFKSCTHALSEAGSMPSDLRALMTNSTSHSLSAIYTQVEGDLVTLLKKSGRFPASGTCEFNPENFTAAEAVASAGNMDVVRAQIFGGKCSSQESVRAYIAALPKNDGKMLTNYMDKVSKVIETIQRAEETEESEQEVIAELEADLEEVGSSLLALDSGAELEDAEGSDRFIETVIMIIIGVIVGSLVVHLLVFALLRHVINSLDTLAPTTTTTTPTLTSASSS